MNKYFLFGSVIVSVALFSGCGGSGGSSDTTPPTLTNSTSSFIVNAGTEKSVSLTANESDVTFSEDAAEATIDGSNLVFSAPNFNSSGENSYTVNVFATDKAGNKSAAKVFTFDVKANIAKNYELNSSYIALIGDKSFTKVGGYLEDPSGLLWDDVVSAKMDYNSAKSYCEAKGTGWRIPTRAEFLNIIDYSKSSASLIDNDFTKYSADSVEVSWVDDLTGGAKYVVNHTGGADTTLSNDANHTVLCVYGDKNTTAHTFANVAGGVRDNVTGLTWTPINTSGPIDYDRISCPNGFTLPTINQLRSIIDYKTNTITNKIATALPNSSNPNTYFVWSSTQGKASSNGKDTHYTIYLDGVNTKAGVQYDEDNKTHYYTCVK